jgi:type VI secretion system secreted protein VgrG
VQYRETHLAFVSRLLEDEGIFYYFEHAADKHVLVSPTAAAAPGARRRALDGRRGAGVGPAGATRTRASPSSAAVHTEGHAHRLRLRRARLASLEASGGGGGRGEVFDYPAATGARRGHALRALRLEEASRGARRRRASAPAA